MLTGTFNMHIIVLILVFVTSFLVVLYCTPPLIKVAILKRLFDEPNERKIHKRVIPTIGGIIIFAATLFSFSLWYNIDVNGLNPAGNLEQISQYINEFKLIVATSLLLFFVGVKDDIIGTAPIKKLVAHVIVGLILVMIGGVKITGLHGVLAIETIPDWASVFLSLFTYIVVVNAFNLIDGVDGLAGGVGFLTAMAFGLWFAFARDFVLASLAFALAGSLLGFLIFNFNPAKIFMGDSGSLTVGLIICFLSIKMVEFPADRLQGVMVSMSKPVLVVAILIYPLTDTMRVFMTRAAKGVSPFSADRNHLHHRLIDCGLSHKATVILIYSFNVIMIGIAISTYALDPSLALLIMLAVTGLAVFILHKVYRKKNPKLQTELEFKD